MMMHNFKVSYINDKVAINNQACIMRSPEQAAKYATGAGLILAKAISGCTITSISIASAKETFTIAL
jgi:hypothetical protein